MDGSCELWCTFHTEEKSSACKQSYKRRTPTGVLLMLWQTTTTNKQGLRFVTVKVEMTMSLSRGTLGHRGSWWQITVAIFPNIVLELVSDYWLLIENNSLSTAYQHLWIIQLERKLENLHSVQVK